LTAYQAFRNRGGIVTPAQPDDFRRGPNAVASS
jgi:hypothetical protein